MDYCNGTKQQTIFEGLMLMVNIQVNSLKGEFHEIGEASS
jgi:hypothetical protein